MPSAFWICAGVTAVSAFVSLGYSVVAVARSGGTARVNARYACSRSLALAAVATIVLLAQSPSWLPAVALIMVVVQAGDAVVGAIARDRLKTVGPALTSVANLVALVSLVSFVYFAR
jgi:hypothetical protein